MEPALIPSRLTTLEGFLEEGPYVGYVYSYPHKTSYREFDRPRPVSDLWRNEPKDALFLYVHVPFCEMRCGFCNLFTYSQPDRDLPTAYLQALRRQGDAIRRSVGDCRFARFAVGGGTPTFLNTQQLTELFDIVSTVMGAEAKRVPVSFETSPATIDAEKAKLLTANGVDRISMGVQSWDAQDVGSMGRPQQANEVEQAIELIRDAQAATLNLDLIYGADGQTRDSWEATVRRTIAYRPEEIYLYPLYVRPLTGLSKRPVASDGDPRLLLYRAGRDLLLEHGYEQLSMRMFQLPRQASAAPAYRCQEDGMIGLGCGARSYTTRTHYADSFAVGQASILRIIEQYVGREANDWEHARLGFELDADEQRRRYLIISLLTNEGLELSQYERRFGGSPLADFPQLVELLERRLAEVAGGWLRLTAAGLENSDAIGPWLYSADVRRRMETFPWR